MKTSVAAIALFVIATPAWADWQYAKWGATPAEVVAAGGGKAHLIPAGTGGTYRDGRVQLAAGTHAAGSRTFEVKFVFRENRLTDVELGLPKAGAPECYALETDLTALYGEPISKSNGSAGDILSRKWADRSHNNQLAYLYVTFSTGCRVTYSAIESAETTGL